MLLCVVKVQDLCGMIMLNLFFIEGHSMWDYMEAEAYRAKCLRYSVAYRSVQGVDDCGEVKDRSA